MHSPLTSTEAVVLALGGTGEVARMMGVKPQVVTNWRSMEKFPAHTYLALKAALEKSGKKAPDKLWRMKAGAAA